MFTPFYYAKHNADIIYYTYDSSKEGYEFYINDKLIEYKEGTFGEFNFSHEDYNLTVKTKVKTTQTLTASGKEVPLTKIKKKELQKILAGKGINNDVNPTAEQIEENRFKLKTLLIPALLMLAGFAIQYYVQGKPKSSQLIAAVPEAIAGWMLYDIVSTRVSWLKNIRKGRLGFMALVVVGLGILGEVLFPLF